MISRMEIIGFGPHRHTQISLHSQGTTVISGPSEVGKTTLLEAILFVLLGRSQEGRFRPEQIQDGAERADVRLTLDDGRVLRRTASRNRSIGRMIFTHGQRETFSSEARYAEALGALVQDEEAAHVVITPLAWQGLVAANARPFRDLLTRALPDTDPAQEVRALMAAKGLALSPEEAGWDERTALQKRRDARQRRDALTGSLETITEQLAQAQALADQVTLPDPAPAQALLEAEAQWLRHEREDQSGALAAEQARRLAALGEPPAPASASGAESLEAARRAEAEAEQHLQDITERWREARRRHDQLQEQLDEVAQTAEPDVCPTCSRPGWEEGAARVTQLHAQRHAAAAALQIAQEDGQRARTAQEAARSRMQAALAAQAQRDAWQAARAALGEPAPSSSSFAAAAAAPPPTLPRPDAAQLAQAHADLAACAAAQGARSQREADILRLGQRQLAIQDDLQQATAESLRLEALLEAVRQAPSRVAERQATALGDLGPVSLEFGENPAVSVRIDGRPWWLASRGRQVVADVCLRAALRRAFGLERLPLVIDNVQDVGGQPLPTPSGPVIVLRTTDDPSISISSPPGVDT